MLVEEKLRNAECNVKTQPTKPNQLGQIKPNPVREPSAGGRKANKTECNSIINNQTQAAKNSRPNPIVYTKPTKLNFELNCLIKDVRLADTNYLLLPVIIIATKPT